jgi:hypothetical protein
LCTLPSGRDLPTVRVRLHQLGRWLRQRRHLHLRLRRVLARRDLRALRLQLRLRRRRLPARGRQRRHAVVCASGDDLRVPTVRTGRRLRTLQLCRR